MVSAKDRAMQQTASAMGTDTSGSFKRVLLRRVRDIGAVMLLMEEPDFMCE